MDKIRKGELPVQQDLPFVKKIEKKEENIKWKGKIGDGNRDQYGDEGETILVYDNGKCTQDGVVIPFSAFLFAIGPNKFFYKNDENFKKMLKAEGIKSEE